MLAYLWETHPELIPRWLESLGLSTETGWSVSTQVSERNIGRFDLVIEAEGEAYVIVESKLAADLTAEQLERYVRYASTRPEPLRAVIALTQHPVPDHVDVTEVAEELGVVFVMSRWQALAAVTASVGEGGLPGEFVSMLVEEGLVMPESLGSVDWDTWNRGAAVMARVKALLTEARREIARVVPGLQPSGRWGVDERWIYSMYSSDRIELGVGFAANESSRRPDSPPIVWACVKNKEIGQESVRARAAEACRAVAGASEPWTGYPGLSKPAAEVLAGADFRAQAAELTVFAFDVVDVFRSVGYLPADLPRGDRPAA
ncbi:MAG: PD-(D/E)XK nuclease family protein [Thermoleophilia bacterium]